MDPQGDENVLAETPQWPSLLMSRYLCDEECERSETIPFGTSIPDFNSCQICCVDFFVVTRALPERRGASKQPDTGQEQSFTEYVIELL